MLNFLRERATIPLFKVLCNAVQSGDLEFAEELFAQTPIVDPQELYESAIRSGSIRTVEWLTGKGLSYIPTERHVRLAVLSRNPEMLEFLRKEGCSWEPNLHTLAVKRNVIPMLRYLLKNCPREYWTSPPLDVKKYNRCNACGVQEILACKKTRRWIRKHGA